MDERGSREEQLFTWAPLTKTDDTVMIYLGGCRDGGTKKKDVAAAGGKKNEDDAARWEGGGKRRCCVGGKEKKIEFLLE
ncbi:hypothetical protein LguiA_004067 [Lonicera macranthoides]